jgi:NTE family protein
MRIPVDCVVGASMGALVGGAFATGMTADEMQDEVGNVSWEETIAFRGKREKLPMRRKLAGTTYSNSVELGVRDGRIVSPRGFINTQNIEQTISRLVVRASGVTDFEKLAVPYRAIATDMQTGEMVVLSNGDLGTAMRASMAVPGVFAPVTIDNRILGDGGLSRNVPVDVARQTCADVVIAVAVPSPVPTAEELQSPLSMMRRTIDVLIGANEREQLDSLAPQDVKIIVDAGGIGPTSFSKAAGMVPLGREAAERQRAALARYSLPESEYLAWRAAHQRALNETFKLASVQVEGLERVDPAYARVQLDVEPGQVVTAETIRRKTSALYSLDDFESVQYSLTGDREQARLTVNAHEKSWGPNILKFDLGLHIGTDGDTAFVLGGNYLRSWVNRRGGEIHGLVQLGRSSAAHVSFYQPLDMRHQYFIEPGMRLEQSLEDLYLDGQAVTRYRFGEAFGYLEAGREFGTNADLRFGLRSGVQNARRDIAIPGLPEIRDEGFGGWTADFTYDNRNRPALATRGWLARLNYFRAVESLGSATEYERLEGMLIASIPFQYDVVSLGAAGGTSFGSTLPPNELFVLGGPRSFPGFKLGELRGQEYWTAFAAYLKKIADISPLFGQALYAGLRLTAGEMNERLDESPSELIYSGAALIGAQTPLGPLNLSLALSNTAQWQLVLNLGRPMDERTITDPAW